MIFAHDEDLIGKAETLERLKVEVARLAKNFAGITSSDEGVIPILTPGMDSAGYFMSTDQDSVEPRS